MRTSLSAIFMLSLTMLAASNRAWATDEAMFDLDPKWRAKIAKEKVKQAYEQRQGMDLANGIDSPRCGSQSIGNVNTGGVPGTAPREVFVFAPNAINLVSGNGCK